jgi:hypothetical protein
MTLGPAELYNPPWAAYTPIEDKSAIKKNAPCNDFQNTEVVAWIQSKPKRKY